MLPVSAARLKRKVRRGNHRESADGFGSSKEQQLGWKVLLGMEMGMSLGSQSHGMVELYLFGVWPAALNEPATHTLDLFLSE